MAILLNSFLVWIYWTYARIVLAQEGEKEVEQGAKWSLENNPILAKICQAN